MARSKGRSHAPAGIVLPLLVAIVQRSTLCAGSLSSGRSFYNRRGRQGFGVFSFTGEEKSRRPRGLSTRLRGPRIAGACLCLSAFDLTR